MSETETNDLTRTTPAPLAEQNRLANEATDLSLSPEARANALIHDKAREVAQFLAEQNGRTLGDRILVLPVPRSDHYANIIIPEEAQVDETCGIVVGVGRGHDHDIVVGNYVIFSKYAARTFKLADVELYQIAEADVIFAAGK